MTSHPFRMSHNLCGDCDHDVHAHHMMWGRCETDSCPCPHFERDTDA